MILLNRQFLYQILLQSITLKLTWFLVFLAPSSNPTCKCSHQEKLELVRQKNRTTFTLLIKEGEKEERGRVSERERNRVGVSHVHVKAHMLNSRRWLTVIVLTLHHVGSNNETQVPSLVPTTLTQWVIFPKHYCSYFIYLHSLCHLLLEQTFVNSSNICLLFSFCNR